MSDLRDRYRVVQMTPIDVELDLADYRTFVRSQPASASKRHQPAVPPRLVVLSCYVRGCLHDRPCPVHGQASS